MRRALKEITERAVIEEIFHRAAVGRLGTMGKDGYPMIKPLNFVYHAGAVYFHTALEGEKIDDIRRNDRVCFEVDQPISYVKSDAKPCSASYLFRSVIIRGRGRMVSDREEKVDALGALMKKYQPEGGYGDFSEEKLTITGVVRIDIEEMAGKQDLASYE